MTRFGKILPTWHDVKNFGHFERVHLVFGNILNLLWFILQAIGQIFIFVNGQILNKYLIYPSGRTAGLSDLKIKFRKHSVAARVNDEPSGLRDCFEGNFHRVQSPKWMSEMNVPKVKKRSKVERRRWHPLCLKIFQSVCWINQKSINHGPTMFTDISNVRPNIFKSN